MPIGRQTFHLLWQLLINTSLFSHIKNVLHAYGCSADALALFEVEDSVWVDSREAVHERLLEILEAVESNPSANTYWDDSLRCLTEAVLCEILDAGQGRVFPALEHTYGDKVREWAGRLLNRLEQDGYRFEEGRLLPIEGEPSEGDTDSLTQILSRKALEFRLARAILRCRESKLPLSIAFIDLDDFKSINDNMGHQAGDSVLTTVGSILKRSTHDRGAFAGRYGGDEFILVAPNQTPDELHSLVKRILQELAATDSRLSLSTGRNVGCSVGIAFAKSSETMSPSELIHQADQAVYAAKAEGKGRIVIFSPELTSVADRVEVNFRFLGNFSVQIGTNIEVNRWRHHRGEDNFHFEAQVVTSTGRIFESENIHTMSIVGAWTGQVSGILKSFRQTGKVVEFSLSVTRDIYGKELLPSCK